MMSCSVWVLSLLVLGSILSPTAAISCSDGISTLLPCRPFLVGSGPPVPTPQCCAGAQALNQMATTREIRRSLCKCLKATAKSVGVNPVRAKQLSLLCHIQLYVPIQPDVDCNRSEYLGVLLFVYLLRDLSCLPRSKRLLLSSVRVNTVL
ncbi:non-specific lipid-transfer protein AP10-like [Telopea speciosissima]|uniref:non-specific lipid-transfer protein AP10-like n=1 Tax=Telopea speciosissima TaxID=54955 RepID=UPI001CC33DFA|nr:non-specific lipid-transfer protein AP10-like [Telopea speciosissima]